MGSVAVPSFISHFFRKNPSVAKTAAKTAKCETSDIIVDAKERYQRAYQHVMKKRYQAAASMLAGRREIPDVAVFSNELPLLTLADIKAIVNEEPKAGLALSHDHRIVDLIQSRNDLLALLRISPHFAGFILRYSALDCYLPHGADVVAAVLAAPPYADGILQTGLVKRLDTEHARQLLRELPDAKHQAWPEYPHIRPLLTVEEAIPAQRFGSR